MVGGLFTPTNFSNLHTHEHGEEEDAYHHAGVAESRPIVVSRSTESQCKECTATESDSEYQCREDRAESSLERFHRVVVLLICDTNIQQ